VLSERTRLSAGARRGCIIDAARGVFSQRGFHGAGTAEIASRAGCSEPTLYKHFASKQALFAAVLEDAGRRMAERVDALIALDDDPVRASLVALTEHAMTDPFVIETVRLRMLAVSVADDPTVRAALHEHSTRMRARVTAIMATARERGLVRDDVDLDAAAWLWLGYALAGGFAEAVEPGSALRVCPGVARTFLQLLRPSGDHGKEAPE
jgi:AcrR family transcriptional regulator